MLGSELTPSMLWYGYVQGAFPMTMDDGNVEWFLPKRRTLLPIEGIRVSKSLRKVIRSGKFEIRFDTAFRQVMLGCLRPSENWISDDFVRVYGLAHEQGWAHSSECWHEGQLVGGVYGLSIGSVFCAESMFHRATDASKVALWALVERCRELGFQLIDAQLMNPHLASLGAYEVPHEEYIQKLVIALRKATDWSKAPLSV
jgi:leucyl/phenylalanyl-tRNA--protein transferase